MGKQLKDAVVTRERMCSVCKRVNWLEMRKFLVRELGLRASETMKTPQNQKRLTNVAIVRYKKGGQRVEVACYPNTVESWREKIETNLDEVLQSRQLFVNVSKVRGVLLCQRYRAFANGLRTQGELAKWELVEKAFGTSDETAILSEILQRGELQVGEKEREAALAKMRKEIASSLAGMSVNPGTMRPYPVTIIEKVMKVGMGRVVCVVWF
jgi:ribosome maturation protein SDO1